MHYVYISRWSVRSLIYSFSVYIGTCTLTVRIFVLQAVFVIVYSQLNYHAFGGLGPFMFCKPHLFRCDQ